MTKPKRLRSGARIALISPASTPPEAKVHLGMQRLQELGYEPVLMPSALAAGPLNFAGNAEARAADLHAAFADPSIDAVLCIRGGWGTAELLPLLNAELIRANPKLFLGYSDPTTLHLLFAQVCGLHTFHAPMLTPDFARGEQLSDGVDLYSWRHALEKTEPWALDARHGMRVLKPGKAEGTLVGGCLALLVESLGTPYAMDPPPGDLLLFLEEVGTKPYQWDRMLLHLRYAGLLDRVRGIILGDMEQCCSSSDEMSFLERTFAHNLSSFAGPIALGLQSGHVHTPNITLPMGVFARLTCTSNATLHILESAVE